MAFYDTTSALRGMGYATKDMMDATRKKGQIEANEKLLSASTAKDIMGAVGNFLNQTKSNIDEGKRKDSLISALENSGASKEIVDAARSANRSDDILPLVALIANPKNIVSTSHSGGKQRIDNVYTGKTIDIGQTYSNSSGGGSKKQTYIPLGDNRNTMLEKNPDIRNAALRAGVLQYDANGSPKTTDLDALDSIIADSYSKNASNKLDSQKQRIQKENQNIDAAMKLMQLQEDLKKKKPLIFGDPNDFFK